MKMSKALEKKRKAVKGGPRRPLTAYNLFFQIGRQRLVNGESVDDISVEDINNMTIHQQARHKLRTTHQRTHGKIGFQELAKTLGEKWKSLNPLCKRRLDELALLEKQRYAAEMAVWKKKNEAPPIEKTRLTTLTRPLDANQQSKISVPSSKRASSSTKKMTQFSLVHPLNNPAATAPHHDQRNGISSTEGFHRYAPPHMEPQAAFHPSNQQNDHFHPNNPQFTSSYQNQPFDIPSNMWQGTVNNMQTTQPYCMGSCDPYHTISPRKVSLSSCQPIEQSYSYDGTHPVHIHEWAPHNAYEEAYHRYPVAHPIEQHAQFSCEETNTVHSLTNIDIDFLSVHCDDNDDISVLGM